MKKWAYMATAVVASLSLVACSANNTDTKKSNTPKTEAKAEVKNEVGKMVETSNNLQVKVTGVKTGFGQSSDKKDMLQVTFSVKNIAKETSGAGAADFKVKADDGKTYKVYGLEAKNFGTEIKAGQTITGTGYYEIPANTKSVTLYYEPLEQKMAQWQLKVPAK
ncbi:lipoprotein [Listeria fleischmannii 1991]|uniref:Telomeric repeat-binding factor 2 n=2 Tax=Listeria fleischmannii TaxID=1069827 RepID=A0A2X3J3T8_9LIST|nr:DUF4352 domain-containing protein [Listeria fleischmannii]EMG28815.1 hypothetical protein LFLEISCH_03685 [Listeria fleischmannii subsp. fleischmannii LU2006-1]KMT60112.1 lipoprotein [Listeria fleischmannii 1991]SQC68780.1 Telomeric repeat-binding factor 2 [Listeria fleischmannii subsp. fleischmannii]